MVRRVLAYINQSKKFSLLRKRKTTVLLLIPDDISIKEELIKIASKCRFLWWVKILRKYYY